MLRAFVCPLDSPPQMPFVLTDAGFVSLGSGAPSSYAATVGPDADEADCYEGSGVFYRNSHTRLTDISDGTSQTVMIGERAWVQAEGIWAGAPQRGDRPRRPANPWSNATRPPPSWYWYTTITSTSAPTPTAAWTISPAIIPAAPTSCLPTGRSTSCTSHR